ncbi:MAG: hypothetical protein ACE5HS_02300 [bacterium]
MDKKTAEEKMGKWSSLKSRLFSKGKADPNEPPPASAQADPNEPPPASLADPTEPPP